MTMFFDGKSFAKAKQAKIRNRIKSKSKRPKLVSILVGDDRASKLYLTIKQKMAKRLGAKLEIKQFPADTPKEKVIAFIKENNLDEGVHGIMIQLPLPTGFSSKDREEIVDSISQKKDVDGLRRDNVFLAPVVKAVCEVLREVGKVGVPGGEEKVVVVGAKGFEGGKIVKVLADMGYRVEGIDKETKSLKSKTIRADILISATGCAGLIKEDMVKEGCVVIDVGSPTGDVEKEAYKRAKFVSAVPGGIGPVTVVNLMENLAESV